MQSKEEFYSDWSKNDLEHMSENIKEYVYQKYVMKCIVFQRDNFKCQNKDCINETNLTIHHIKFKKNNGKDTPRNAITMCKSCHQGYHRGKLDLTFWGATYKLHVPDSQIDWKTVKHNGRKFRRSLREHCGFKISWEMLQILMNFLNKEYIEDGNDDD
jgi:hypothetical protein